jgi:hypothetical protein
MTTEDVSARVAALETVLRHLVTHLALRSDDPPQWVATRRVLALHEVQERASPEDAQTLARLDDVAHAISGFFDPVEGVLEGYGAKRRGTNGPPMR